MDNFSTPLNTIGINNNSDLFLPINKKIKKRKMKNLKDYIYETKYPEYDAKSFKEGDILDGSYHYSAKIPYFYKVLSNNGKTVTVIELKQKIVSDDGYGQNGTCIPLENETKGNEIKARIKKNGEIKIKDCSCKLWDGKPVDFFTD